MAIKNRTDLKSYFVKNAIPTEGNFADLIDSQLNQAQDGVFKPDGEALSVVAAPGDQKRVLRLYANYPAANPDWMISLNPATAGTSRAGFGVTDGTGNTRLFIDALTGQIGVATNAPQFALDVAGGARANGFRGRYDLMLNDYRTANPASNVCLHSPPGDRDTWIYRDVADSGTNWGIYHRQIDTPVAGLPGNSIGFVGGSGSKLQAYVNLADGSGFFAGGLSVQGAMDMSATGTTWNGWLEAIRFSRPEHSAITHPGGKLLFGMHGDRNFYFADTNLGRYVMTISGASGNVGITGALTVNGALNAPAGLIVEGSVAHIDRDGALYQTDGQCYLTVDDHFYIRDSGASAGSWAAHFDTNAGSLELKAGLVAKGYGMLTDPEAKFNCHFPFSDNNSYVTGNNIYLRGGAPTGNNAILTATANGGTVTVAGNLGTKGWSPTANLPSGWGGGVNTWDVVAHGSVWSVNPYRNGNFDLAEKFAHHEDGLEAGDVVAVDPKEPERLIRSPGARHEHLLGVISEKPGFELGVSWEAPDSGVSLALCGRVPVKVTVEGGAIRIGDYLTSSSRPGYAMRATQPGRVIGVALSAFDGAKGAEGRTIVLVNPHWYGGQ